MYILFDTNVYRDLTYGLNQAEAKIRFDKIKVAEAQLGYIPALSTVTAMELLAHLADKSLRSYELCKIAVVAAGHHVSTPPEAVSIFPHPQLQLQQLIFGNYDEHTMSKFEIIMEIVNFLNIGPAEDYILNFDEQIKEINRLVILHEQDFKATMFSVIKSIDPQTTSWTALKNDRDKRKRILKFLIEKEHETLEVLALGYVHKALRARDQSMSLPETAIAVTNVITYFRTALLLHIAIMKKMLIGGFDMDNPKHNRENTIWDIYQLFSVSDSTMNDQHVLFVTADEWLHEVSQASGLQSKIIRKKEYLEMLAVDI